MVKESSLLHCNKHIRSWSRSSAFTLQQEYQVMVKELSLYTATSISGHGHGAQPSHCNEHIRLMVKELSLYTAKSISGHGQGAQPSHCNKHIRS
jgi:hypothetical protein